MPVTIDYRIQTNQYEHRQAWLPGGPREIPGLGWADVVRVVADALGLPVKFYTRDFLTTMVFQATEENELTVAFCSQGRRRGEVLLSIPATANGAAALMEQLGDAIEARQAEIRQAALDDGIPAEYLDAEEQEEDWWEAR